MEPIMLKLQEVLAVIQVRSRRWAKKLRTRTRKLERQARARFKALDPRQPKRTKKGRFAKKPQIRPVQAAA
jgi:hypothetical protein